MESEGADDSGLQNLQMEKHGEARMFIILRNSLKYASSFIFNIKRQNLE